MSKQQEGGWSQKLAVFFAKPIQYVVNSQDLATKWQDVCDKTAVDNWPHCVDIYSALYFYLCISVHGLCNFANTDK